MPLLTRVDLPGLVKNASHDQSMEGMRTVDSLSDCYMGSRRTIIPAILGGNTDYVQAPILTKVRHFDTTDTRTIGILTKPDPADTIDLGGKFIDLIQNKDKQNHLRPGWYHLLNSGPR